MLEVLKIISEITKATILIATAIIFGIILLENKTLRTNRKNIITIIIVIILYSVIINTFSGTLKSLLLWLIYIILYRKIFKISYTDCIFLAFLHAILIMIPDTLFLLLVVYILKIQLLL